MIRFYDDGSSVHGYKKHFIPDLVEYRDGGNYELKMKMDVAREGTFEACYVK